MSLLTLTVVIALLLGGLVSIGWNRGAIVIAMLIPASDFLGWVDPSVISIRGVFDTFALLLMFIVLALVLSLHRLAELRTATFRWPMLILGLLWLYGLIAPAMRGDSGWRLAINASKEFMMILAYPAIFLFLRTEKNVAVAWKALIALGIYYSAMELLAQLGGVRFMSLTSYFYRPDDFGLWKLYVQYWPVILIFLLASIYSSILEGRWALVSVLLGGAGLFLTFYRSYVLAAFVAIPLVAILAKVRLGRTVISGAALAGVLIAVMGFVSIANGNQGPGLSDVGDDLLLSSFRELRDDSGGSLAGRKRYARELLELANAHPLIGYGFVKQEAQLIQQLHLATFAGGMLGFVDKGDADVMVKFGYLGGAALYISFIWISFAAISKAKRIEDDTVRIRLLTIAALPFIYLMVQPVHAPCTYGFALLPLAIAMAIADRQAWLLKYSAGGDE